MLKNLYSLSLIIFAATVAIVASGCGASNGGGGSGSSPFPQQYAYVANQASNTITQYSVGADGALTPLDVPTVATGVMPVSIAADSTRSHLYVANRMDDTISQYAVANDGTLSQTFAPIATGSGPFMVVLSPDGSSLYAVSGYNDEIWQYAIDLDGQLSLTATFATGVTMPLSMNFDPTGAYAYVASAGDIAVAQFSVGRDGSLTALTPSSAPLTAMPAGPLASGTASNGSSFNYVLVCGDNTVQTFPIGANGALGSSSSIATGSCPTGMTASRTNLYVTNSIDRTISMYQIEADGSLSPLAQPTVPAGDSPEALVLDHTGRFAYATDFHAQTVLQYAVGAGGALTPLATASIATDAGPVQVFVNF